MNIEIDGPEVTRGDGTVRCIGYGEDGEGRVTGRFALPSGAVWDAPDGTKAVEFVDAMADLPSINDQYRRESE